jgi:hypothetical protein
MIRQIALFSGIVILSLAFSSAVRAQPSLASEDINDQFDVVVGSETLSFTVLRDAREAKQWYYVPNSVRLFERTLGQDKIPDFSLLRYQFKDPQNQQNLLEGGLLQFAVTFAAPAGTVDALRKKLSQQTQIPENQVRLAPLPMRDVKMQIYAPGQGNGPATMVTSTSADVIGNTGPIFATQKMPFSMTLTSVGADVYEAMTNGNTGVTVGMSYSFVGLSKPAGFKITVDWDKTYDFYSSDKKTRALTSLYGWTASYSSDRSSMMETLKQKDCIKFEAYPGETLTLADMYELAAPFLDRINKEMLEKVEPPNEIPPATAQDPPKASYRKSVTRIAGEIVASSTGVSTGGYSVAVKKANFRRTGQSEFDFRVAQPVTVNAGFGGFIGIGQYPDSVRDSLVSFVPLGPWQSAYLALPTVTDQYGITSVSVEASVNHNSTDYLTSTATWSVPDGWETTDGKPITRFVFPLSALPAAIAGQPMTNLKLKLNTKITHMNKVIEVTKVVAAFDGEKAITTPLDVSDVEWVEVDATGLPWKSLGAGELVRVNIKLTSNGEALEKQIRPRLENGQYYPPLPQYVLFRRTNDPIKAQISFNVAGANTPIESNASVDNLRAANQSMAIFLGALE